MLHPAWWRRDFGELEDALTDLEHARCLVDPHCPEDCSECDLTRRHAALVVLTEWWALTDEQRERWYLANDLLPPGASLRDAHIRQAQRVIARGRPVRSDRWARSSSTPR